MDDTKVLDFLKAQNYDINARKWRIITKHPADLETDAICTISMDDASAAIVKSRNDNLSYRTGHIRLYPVAPKPNKEPTDEEGKLDPNGDCEMVDDGALPSGGICLIPKEQQLEDSSEPSSSNKVAKTPSKPVKCTVQTSLKEHLKPKAKAIDVDPSLVNTARDVKMKKATGLTPPSGGITPALSTHPPPSVLAPEGKVSPVQQRLRKAQQNTSLVTEAAGDTATTNTTAQSPVEHMEGSFSEEESLLLEE